MARWCTRCSGPLPDDAQFCPACGLQVTTGERPKVLDDMIGIELNRELRHITVVFCDLVGSTELSSSVDAEEYSDLIQSYQQQAVAIVRAVGGDVEGYSGDGILFRFGWPEAHDDDAAHALTAALDIVEAIAQLDGDRRLAVRVGVHSGPAVVGLLGGADRRATMAVGETLNISARLQAAAEPGTVVASAATIALVEGRFDLTPLGPLELRGVPQPVEAFRVVGRNGRPLPIEVSANRRSRLVGREPELDNAAPTLGPGQVREGSRRPDHRGAGGRASPDWPSRSATWSDATTLPLGRDVLCVLHPDECTPTGGRSGRGRPCPCGRTPTARSGPAASVPVSTRRPSSSLTHPI